MTRSEAVVNLQALYGPPSQAGFGSAVFCDRVERAEDLETAALKHYRYFLGKAWEQFGDEAWMVPWKQVYQRQAADNRNDIVTELRSITDPAAQSSVTMVLDAIADPEAGRQALSAVYDDADMDTLVVYTLGDGAALSGLLIAGRDRRGETTLLLFLLD
jgi:DNA polymerase IIIc chi subunit